MATPSAASSCSLTEPEPNEIIMRVDNVRMYINGVDDGVRTLFVTGRYVSHIDSEGGVRFYYNIINDYGMSRELSIYPQECIYAIINVNRGREAVSMNLKKYVLHVNRLKSSCTEAAAAPPQIDQPPEEEPGMPEGYEVDTSGMAEIRFVPPDPLLLDSIHMAMSDAAHYGPDYFPHMLHPDNPFDNFDYVAPQEGPDGPNGHHVEQEHQ